MRKEKELVKVIKARKLQYLGHVYQGSKLQYLANNSRREHFQEEIEGKNGYLGLSV